MSASPWKPLSQAEWLGFERTFCEKCQDEAQCPIAADGRALDIAAPAFPREWIIGHDGPECTAFVAVDVEQDDDWMFSEDDEEDEDDEGVLPP